MVLVTLEENMRKIKEEEIFYLSLYCQTSQEKLDDILKSCGYRYSPEECIMRNETFRSFIALTNLSPERQRINVIKKLGINNPASVSLVASNANMEEYYPTLSGLFEKIHNNNISYAGFLYERKEPFIYFISDRDLEKKVA